MNILVCLWGQLRGDVNLVISNYRNIFKDFSIDFVLFTWESQIVENDAFSQIFKYPDPTNTFLDVIEFPFTQQLIDLSKERERVIKGRIGHYAQFFHNKNICDFLKTLDQKYDILIKSRADLVFATNFNFDFSKNLCYVPKNYYCGGGWICDHFIAGNFETVKKAIQIDDLRSFYPILADSFNPEEANVKLIEQNNCKIQEFYCDSYMLLPDRKFI